MEPMNAREPCSDVCSLCEDACAGGGDAGKTGRTGQTGRVCGWRGRRRRERKEVRVRGGSGREIGAKTSPSKKQKRDSLCNGVRVIRIC